MNVDWEDEWSGLPGAEFVRQGLADLDRNMLTESALLILVAAPRLTALGIPVKTPQPLPSEPLEHALYALLEDQFGAGAYTRYNSLIRRMVSFARALEREKGNPKTSNLADSE